jgi:hypothetical protein
MPVSYETGCLTDICRDYTSNQPASMRASTSLMGSRYEICNGLCGRHIFRSFYQELIDKVTAYTSQKHSNKRCENEACGRGRDLPHWVGPDAVDLTGVKPARHAQNEPSMAEGRAIFHEMRYRLLLKASLLHDDVVTLGSASYEHASQERLNHPSAW